MAQAHGLTNSDERGEFYHLAEGSEVYPLVWLFALDRADGTPFIQGLDRYGFLPEARGPGNQLGLPVGMTAVVPRDVEGTGTPFVGVNCAACHVGEVQYRGSALRIDGAPNLLDIERFYSELRSETFATFKDAKRLWEFLGRAVKFENEVMNGWRGSGQVRNGAAALRPGTAELLARHQTFDSLKRGSAADCLLARRIERTVSALDDKCAGGTAPLPASASAADAYATEVHAAAPDIADADVRRGDDVLRDLAESLQLIQARLSQSFGPLPYGAPGGFGRTDAFGIVRKATFDRSSMPTAPICYPHLWGFGATRWLHWNGNTTAIMQRNIGQAIGLGALARADSNATTVLARNLHRLDLLARRLTAPPWPAFFPSIDEGKRARGGEIYAKLCADCHDSRETSGGQRVDRLVPLSEIGTDPNHALSFDAPVNGAPFVDALATLLAHVEQAALEGIPQAERLSLQDGRPVEWRSTRAYPARPLAGIWASAPYLHNGSVPTLDMLLRACRDRPSTFGIGPREYDPIRVGYRTDDRSRGVFNASGVGNMNCGHEGEPYGTNLSEDDRAALLEYLKSL